MEDELYKAAASGNTNLFREILGRNGNQHLLDVCKFGYFGCSILHVAANNGSIDIVKEILQRNPGLSDALDSRNWSSLHLALVKGDIEMSNELLSCNRYVARFKTSNGDTILHLCLKHGQLESMKLLMNKINDTEFANLTDAEGSTVLHLAVMLNNPEAVAYLIEKKRVNINAVNTTGNTPLDIALQCEDYTKLRDAIIRYLKQNGARTSKLINQERWLGEKRGVLMVVASLIATMAFQAGVSPPGGAWQDNTFPHRAGEAVMAYNYPDSYPYFLRFNTIGFIGSLSTILLLLTGLPSGKRHVTKLLVVIMWVTISAMTVTYAFSITVVTPKVQRSSLTYTIVVGVLVWASVMALLVLWHAVHFVLEMEKPKVCINILGYSRILEHRKEKLLSVQQSV
ncbi:ankyrin repeat-containing protein ITN1-like [Impatiens glandulifera]|uniref:ankyrin repeat-containing protein ITN1-like n=1 Tax=Impatiens glandulifera TaxID=253017 RepID=UPI001FB0D253|nr:ankyrin repeat-containing protein ITN1-like [Impatiens glandulifera]